MIQFDIIDILIELSLHCTVLEGLIPLMLKLTIQHLHGAGIVTVSQFNNQLDMFKFGKNDRGALPVRIPVNFCRTDMSIPGKASEKWCLFRCLPFLVGCSVSSERNIAAFS